MRLFTILLLACSPDPAGAIPQAGCAQTAP